MAGRGQPWMQKEVVSADQAPEDVTLGVLRLEPEKSKTGLPRGPLSVGCSF